MNKASIHTVGLLKPWVLSWDDVFIAYSEMNAIYQFTLWNCKCAPLKGAAALSFRLLKYSKSEGFLLLPFHSEKKNQNLTFGIENKSVTKYYSWESRLSSAFEIFPDLLSLLTASQITQMASQTCCCGKHQVGKIKGEGGRGLVSVTGSAPHLAGWQACEHTCTHTL